MIRIKNPFPPRLPSEYQEVEYIESSGTQYIDTGFIPNQDTRVTMSGMLLAHTANASLFGTRYSASARQFTMTWEDANNRFLSRFGNNDVQIPFTEGTVFYVDKNKNITIVNSVEYTNTDNEFTCSTVLYLFATNNNGSLMHYGKLKLYSCKIYDNGTLVRDFVPCYRLSDNVVGLYDLVNNTFYTNAGTGTFLIGTEVGRRDMNIKPTIGDGKTLLERYIENMLVYKSGPNYIDTEFSSSIMPTSWTSLNSSYNEYSKSNSYGEWKISSTSSSSSKYRLSYAFDNDLDSKCCPSTVKNQEIIIDFPIMIKPKSLYFAYRNVVTGYIQGYNPKTDEWEDLASFASSNSTSTTKETTLSVGTGNFYSKIKIPVSSPNSSTSYICEFQIKSGTIRQEV